MEESIQEGSSFVRVSDNLDKWKRTKNGGRNDTEKHS